MSKQQGVFKSGICVFDFDSTLVSIESLDFLIKNIACQGDEQIEQITNAAMAGKMSFEQSLSMRVSSCRLTKAHIKQMSDEICKFITHNAKMAVSQISQKYDVFIVSGGFLEIILPVASHFGIDAKNCYANSFLYNMDEVCGYDTKNPLCKSGGKVDVVRGLIKPHGKAFMVGDGYTDLEVKKHIDSVIFCGFGANVVRDSVKNASEHFFYNFGDLANFIVNYE